MSNEYFNPSGWPATGSSGSSAPARGEVRNIAAGFDKLPPLSTNADKIVVVNSGGTGQTATDDIGALGVNISGVTNEDGANVATTGGIGKNAIIGGDFSTNPWQRGTSFSSVADNTYTADRWLYSKGGAMVHDVSKSADAPSVAQAGRLITHCMLINCTTIYSSLASSDVCRVRQHIEGYNWLPLAQRDFTISFWHKHTKTGTYCVSFGNASEDKSYVAEYTQAVADTWEKSVITVPASPSAGGWYYDNSIGLRVNFVLACGSSFQTSPNAWQSGNYLATSNQVNACDSTGNNFRIALVQLEPGSVATEFENRMLQREIELCQRYYEMGAFRFRTDPAVTISGIAARFRVDKRTTPTIAITMNLGTLATSSATTDSLYVEGGTGVSGNYGGDFRAEAEL